MDAEEIKHIKTELRQIRDNTTRLLDQLEPKITTTAANDADITGKKVNGSLKIRFLDSFFQVARPWLKTW